ncbi:MAG TPA: DNA-binding protein [candidate division Zixibacteria bacterium]|nr:DNA-binding protein [candidate division Zixibacteria bacterium]HEQ98851.1 DNA-binding protein [candidate division Zixibacteria bacterium]
MDKLLTSKEVCEILGIKLNTLRKWTSIGKLPVIRLSGKGGPVRWRARDIQSFIDGCYVPEDPIHGRDAY